MHIATRHPADVPRDAADCARVSRTDLYMLLDQLTAMQAGLMPLWDPDATIHPLSDLRRHKAHDTLQAAIAKVSAWIERGPRAD